jgi:hypothetical protein
MSEIPPESYSGSGNALVISNKCNKIVPFTSSYNWTFGGDGSDLKLSKLNYNNSFIGSRILSSVFDGTSVEISSDGLLNFNTTYYYDIETEKYYIILRITGVYKKCNYSSYELDVETPSSLKDKSLKNKSRSSESSEEFHKLLDSNPNLNKKYLQIKAKLGK